MIAGSGWLVIPQSATVRSSGLVRFPGNWQKSVARLNSARCNQSPLRQRSKRFPSHAHSRPVVGIVRWHRHDNVRVIGLALHGGEEEKFAGGATRHLTIHALSPLRYLCLVPPVCRILSLGEIITTRPSRSGMVRCHVCQALA